jgi:hypothetical protein
VRAAGLVILTACGFELGSASIDARTPDVPIDMIDVTRSWTIDPESQKAVPANRAEWVDFIAANQLGIMPPDGLWLMQEAAAPLADSIGTIPLNTQGTTVMYQRPVAGWSRLALASSPDSGNAIAHNNQNAGFPRIDQASLTVLALYATSTTPSANRTLLCGGCCNEALLAHVFIDTQNRFHLTLAATGTAAGTMNHGTGPVPLVLKLDRTNMQQRLLTNLETITPPFTPLGNVRGIITGGAIQPTPDGRWLYMAAWYGANAEMTDVSIRSMLDAMGW